MSPHGRVVLVAFSKVDVHQGESCFAVYPAWQLKFLLWDESLSPCTQTGLINFSRERNPDAKAEIVKLTARIKMDF